MEAPAASNSNNVTEIRPGRSISLHKVAATKDPPSGALFFVHGAGGRRSQYREQIAHFSTTGDWDIISYDMLGHGESPKPDLWDAYSTAEFIKDFHSVYMKYRAAGKRNVIIAHSFGVSLCVEWYSELVTVSKATIGVSGFVLLGTSLEAPGSTKHPIFFCPVWLLNSIRPMMAEPFKKLAFHPSTPATLIDAEMANGAQNPMYMMKALVRQMIWLNAIHLQSLHLPTLLLSGEADGLCAPAHARAMIKEIGEEFARFEEVKNAGHILMLEQPAVVNELIENFLRSIHK